MKRESLTALFCIAVLAACMLACEPPRYVPPPQPKYNDITSTPSGATVYFGETRDDITHNLGVTPYHDSGYNMWLAGYYKVEKEGYFPSVKFAEATYGSRSIHFDLAPKPPAPPKAVYPDPESVAITPLALDTQSSFVMRKNSRIATMTFKQHEGSGAGALAADSMILNLQRLGYNVIDREMIENVLKEQKIMAEGRTNLSDIEVSRKIGQLFNADYFIAGAITEYSAKSENIGLSPAISDAERKRYTEEYDRYEALLRDDNITNQQPVKTLQEWEIDYAGKPKSSYINIAKVGITVKIVDIRTSNIVWVGIADTSDLRLQTAMKRIVDGMIHNFTDTEAAKPPKQ